MSFSQVEDCSWGRTGFPATTLCRGNSVLYSVGTNKRGIRFQMGFKLMLRLSVAENLKTISCLKGRHAAHYHVGLQFSA